MKSPLMETYLPTDSTPPAEWVRVPFPLPAYIILRAAGDMRRDGEDRRRFYQRAGLNAELIHVVGQVHSRTVVSASRDPNRGPGTTAGERFYPEADGIVTDDPTITLGVTIADCMPIFITDRRNGARGLLHSGWKGTGILEAAIARLHDEFGCEAADLVVTMGPCISADSYEVDGERATAFAAEWGDGAIREYGERQHLDLRAANQEICRRNGVDLVNVINHCTVKDTRFASFRRQGPREYTLMLALLGGALELETRDS